MGKLKTNKMGKLETIKSGKTIKYGKTKLQKPKTKKI